MAEVAAEDQTAVALVPVEAERAEFQAVEEEAGAAQTPLVLAEQAVTERCVYGRGNSE